MELTRKDGEIFEVSLCDDGEECLVTADSGTSAVTFPNWANEVFQGMYFGEAGIVPYHSCES